MHFYRPSYPRTHPSAVTTWDLKSIFQKYSLNEFCLWEGSQYSLCRLQSILLLLLMICSSLSCKMIIYPHPQLLSFCMGECTVSHWYGEWPHGVFWPGSMSQLDLSHIPAEDFRAFLNFLQLSYSFPFTTRIYSPERGCLFTWIMNRKTHAIETQ